MTNNKESTKYLSDRQELAIARALGGRRTPMSGASKFFKMDVVTLHWGVEAKTQMQEKKTFTVKKEWIDKAVEEAFAINKPHWTLAFNFGGEENTNKNFYIISEEEMKRLVELED